MKSNERNDTRTATRKIPKEYDFFKTLYFSLTFGQLIVKDNIIRSLINSAHMWSSGTFCWLCKLLFLSYMFTVFFSFLCHHHAFVFSNPFQKQPYTQYNGERENVSEIWENWKKRHHMKRKHQAHRVKEVWRNRNQFWTMKDWQSKDMRWISETVHVRQCWMSESVLTWKPWLLCVNTSNKRQKRLMSVYLTGCN